MREELKDKRDTSSGKVDDEQQIENVNYLLKLCAQSETEVA